MNDKLVMWEMKEQAKKLIIITLLNELLNPLHPIFGVSLLITEFDSNLLYILAIQQLKFQ